MNKSTLFKEAVKTSLALTLVYWIGLQFGWVNPYWAGWAVAMIAIPAAAGASLHKGMLRLLGTIPGCFGALLIYYIAGTDRWIFMILTCTWVACNTYLMLIDKKHSYFWNVAGFVALIILLTSQTDSNSLFEYAVFRTIETAMGVVVYTIVALFLWPASNLNQVKSSAFALVNAQLQVLKTAQQSMFGSEQEQKLAADISSRVSVNIFHTDLLIAEQTINYFPFMKDLEQNKEIINNLENALN